MQTYFRLSLVSVRWLGKPGKRRRKGDSITVLRECRISTLFRLLLFWWHEHQMKIRLPSQGWVIASVFMELTQSVNRVSLWAEFL